MRASVRRRASLGPARPGVGELARAVANERATGHDRPSNVLRDIIK